MNVTTKQIQRLDRIAIKQYGVPSIVLMENAGRLVAEEIHRLSNKKRNIIVLAGVGNNAGDGFVVSRHLHEKKYNVQTYLIGKEKQLKGDALTNFLLLKKLKMSIMQTTIISEKVIKEMKECDCVVDAIFGVGLNRDICTPFKEFIDAVNVHAKKVIAIDVPSGLNATTRKSL